MITILWHSLSGYAQYPNNMSIGKFPYYDPVFKELIAVKSYLNKQRKIHDARVKHSQKSVITLRNPRANVIFYEY